AEGFAPRRLLSHALACALLCSATVLLESRRAAAFELFGIHLWGADDSEDAAIADPLRYSVTFDVRDADDDLKERLENASGLKADEERPVPGSLGLMARARAEREQLVAALYADARYDGVVTVSIQGREMDSLPPDAEFT